MCALRQGELRLAGHRDSCPPGLRAGGRMKRVLFVDHAAVLGGAELSLLDIATALRDRSSVVLFEHGPFETVLAANGVRVDVLDGGADLKGIKKESRLPSPGTLGAVTRLAKQLAQRARAADLLYANSPKSFLIAALA